MSNRNKKQRKKEGSREDFVRDINLQAVEAKMKE